MKQKILFILLLINISFVFAQEKKDSLYYKIEEFSDKRKVTKFFHRFIFRREPDSVSVVSTKNIQVLREKSKRVIRNVKIVTIDPFGYSESKDKVKDNWYDWFTNHLHTNSRQSTINNYLLFKEGEFYDANRIYESERLLRSMNFINRVNISIDDINSDKDSVNVLVKVLDSWSLKPSINYSANRLGTGLKEENFLGLGHQVEFNYSNEIKEKQNYYYGSYTANNLFGTYINAHVSGEIDFLKNEKINFNISRGFFSPLTRWGGGFNFEYFMRKVLLPLENSDDFPEVQIKVFNQDLWAGYQFPLNFFRDDNMRNIAIMGRVINYQYKDRPGIDIQKFFRSYNAFLVSTSFNERNYKIKNQIFQYNLPEDIPYGKSFGLTGGLLKRSLEVVPYLGSSIAYGNFNPWGYLSIKAEMGRFFDGLEEKRDAYFLESLYFTNLQDYKILKGRHFFSTTYAFGSNEINYSYRDRINISQDSEFPIYSLDFIGTKKFILRYQFQTFINKTWKNFHFSPYIFATMGWLAGNGQKIFNSKTNTKFGLGVIINNPYLVFNRFQISFVYYPRVPFDNDSQFTFNGYRNDMLPINNFSGEVPHFVNFGN